MEIQWNWLLTLQYKDICSSSIPIQAKDTSEFWVDVSKLKNSDGEKSFTDISEFALRILSLPLANASVERVFSIMNAVKTKARNRMQMSTLEAILRLRLHLYVSNFFEYTF